MKKKEFKGLSLAKKTVSSLGKTNEVKGGNGSFFHCGPSLDCTTNHPTCLEPTGISACIRCFEEFTEGCGTGAFCGNF